MKRNNNTAERRAAILDAALEVATATHYKYMTRQQVATAAGVSGPLVGVYFGSMAALRREVMREAVARRAKRIIAQGIIAHDPQALALDRASRCAVFRPFT